MSSILKALKRLENENAARKPDSFRIDAEILKSGTSRKTSSVSVMIAGCALFACGGLVAYIFLKSEMTPTQVAVSPPVHGPENRPEALVVVKPPIETPAEQTTDRSMPPSRPANAAPQKNMPSQAPLPRPQPQLEKPVDIIRQAEPVMDPKPLPPSTSVAVPTVKPAALKLDGIAFQDGGTDNLAVVNGTTVTKGSLIEGARVEEIKKDRVRFSRGAEIFEIILEKSN